MACEGEVKNGLKSPCMQVPTGTVRLQQPPGNSCPSYSLSGPLRQLLPRLLRQLLPRLLRQLLPRPLQQLLP